MIALDVAGLAEAMFKTFAGFCVVTGIGAWVLYLARDPPPPAITQTMSCHAAGGWWVAATLDKNGEPKMWACVDDAGRLVRLTEDK